MTAPGDSAPPPVPVNPAPGRLRPPRRRGLVILGVALLVSALVAGVVLAGPFVFHHSPGSSGTALLPSQPSCTGNFTDPAASFVITTSNPGANAIAGTWLTVTYQVKAITASSGTTAPLVTIPTVSAVFPTQGGGALIVQIAPRTLAVSLSGWSDGTGTTHSRPLNNSTNFLGNASAYLSTSKIAVTSVGPLGSIAVEIRWEWVLALTGGPGLTSGWTVPTPRGPASSELYPEPGLRLVSTGSTNVTIGSTYSVSLSGAVSGATLFLKLENATTGANLRQATVTAPEAAGAVFNASIMVLGNSGELLPGKYLLHVHDGCGALLYSVALTAHH